MNDQCAECGMPCEPGEYHPFAACLMFKACHNSTTVRANLAAVSARAALEAQAAPSAQQAAQPLTRADGMPTSETERKLRRMLCAVYAGSVAYMDDGEASLGDRIPFIDFMRMTPDEIDGAMRERALAMLAAAPQQPPQG